MRRIFLYSGELSGIFDDLSNGRCDDLTGGKSVSPGLS